MIIATLTKIVAGVAVLGALSTVAFNVIPHPESDNGIWLDTPLDEAQVEEGNVHVVLHSDLPGITGIYVSVMLDDDLVTVLRDDDLEKVERGAGAARLSVFDQIWSVGNPGEYTLNVSVSGSADTKRSFTVTVLDEGGVSVDSAEGTSVPTPTPTPTPTVEPPVGPDPDPEPEEDGPVVPGSVTRFQGTDDDWLSQFYINSFAPENATVTLQVRITDSINDVPGEWQEYSCYGNTPEGTPGLYNCVISDHYLDPPLSFLIDGTWMPFSVEYYAIISTDGESAYAPGGTWETQRR